MKMNALDRCYSVLGKVWRSILLSGLALAVQSAVRADPGAGSRPNFVIILADDMGYSDPGCYGGEIRTPNLDRLAAEGLRFTQFYNTARCWPSRACILTGYYAQQVGRDNLPGYGGGAAGKRPGWARLLPELLRPLGYRSYHSGKWHLDGPVLAGGFDRSYSVNDHDRHFNPRQHTLDDQPLPPVASGGGYYSTTAIAQHAIEMLAEHKTAHGADPFFLYLAFISPHFPLQALPQDIDVYRGRYQAGWDDLRRERYTRMRTLGLINCDLSKLDPESIPGWNLPERELQAQIGAGEAGHAVPWDGLTPAQKEFQPVKMAIHAAMVHRMDIEIGRVLEQLAAIGAAENTVVFFLSDNGASAEQIIRGDRHDKAALPGSAGTFLSLGPGWSSAANTPFRLHKTWVHEGGISTPLIVRWPKGITARGELRTNPGHVVDLAPTIVELAGGRWPVPAFGKPLPPAPGRSLTPAFAKDGTVVRPDFWWFHEGNRALRAGDWKLVADHDKPWELYDLQTDRAESRNLADQHPDKVAELGTIWTNHLKEFQALAAETGKKPVQPGKRPAGKAKARAEQSHPGG